MNSPRKLTMTLEDVCQIFRAHGIPMEKGRLSRDIAAGLYPFGRVIDNGKSRKKFEIWTIDVLNFIDSKTPKST